MTSPYTLRDLSPILGVNRMEESLEFYTQVLGFSISMESPYLSIIERDGRALRLQWTSGPSIIDGPPGSTELYLEVSGIHALWEHVWTFRERHIMGGLFARPNGMTEFSVVDPDRCRIWVVEPTANIPESTKLMTANRVEFPYAGTW